MLHSIAGPEWVHIFSPPIIILFCLSSSYIGYYYLFHPLAKYPGPFLASFSNLWKLYHLWSLHLPERLVELHETYGPIVRVGPNDLSFQSGDAVAPIYKAGRALKKTKFYDGFTTFNPNLFGTQNEEVFYYFPDCLSLLLATTRPFLWSMILNTSFRILIFS